GKPFRLMFQDVELFFKQCLKNCTIILSGLALQEIEKIAHYPKEETLRFFKEREIEVEVVEACQKDARTARQFLKKGGHYSDALHAALAINSSCTILLTFNKKNFTAVENLLKVREPADLIQ
ncbi:MAG: PIN domain-containing protein, partial [Candidatus Diapherotrites archaeon]|nr:PIN domain-containing protein [Candidatus Diapherotrites archaeon]